MIGRPVHIICTVHQAPPASSPRRPAPAPSARRTCCPERRGAGTDPCPHPGAAPPTSVLRGLVPPPPGGGDRSRLLLTPSPPEKPRGLAGGGQTARPGGGECVAAGRGAGRAGWAGAGTPRTEARLASAAPRAALRQAPCGSPGQLLPGDPARGPRRSSVASCLPDPEDRGSRTTRNHPTWHRR